MTTPMNPQNEAKIPLTEELQKLMSDLWLELGLPPEKVLKAAPLLHKAISAACKERDGRIIELEKQLNKLSIKFRNYYAGAIHRHEWESVCDQTQEILKRKQGGENE